MPGDARTPEDRLDAAFTAAPRVRFLPSSQQRFAGLDRPLPIGHDQTSSQPSTVREMLSLLDVRAGQRVLVVPVAGRMTVVRRGDDGVAVVRLGSYSFVPLVGS